MDVGDSFACPDDASYLRARGIAAQMPIYRSAAFAPKGRMKSKAGKSITDRRVWRVSQFKTFGNSACHLPEV